MHQLEYRLTKYYVNSGEKLRVACMYRILLFNKKKNSHHEDLSTNGLHMSTAAILEVRYLCKHKKEQLDMPNNFNVVNSYEITAGSGYNLLEGRSHEVQYTVPIIGYFHSLVVWMTHTTGLLKRTVKIEFCM